MRIPFDITKRPQIESGEFKVETRSGKTARVVCWDRGGTQLVVLVGKDEDVLTYNPNGTTGQQMPLPSDLFIVTPDQELSELELAIAKYRPPTDSKETIQRIAAELLSLARKQLQPEIDAEIEKAYRTADEVQYTKGREEALKDLPRWKKCGEDTLRTYGEEHFEYRGGVCYLVMKGREIILSALEKLSKEG